jgi:hypothetical protein
MIGDVTSTYQGKGRILHWDQTLATTLEKNEPILSTGLLQPLTLHPAVRSFRLFLPQQDRSHWIP